MPPRRSARIASKSKEEEEAASTAATTTARAATPKKKRKVAAAASSSSPSPKKIKKTGLKNAPQTTSAPLGVIDPDSGLSGEICVHDDEPCDVMLVLVDPTKNMDKFFILQLIEGDGGFIMYTRWGRTGTVGQGQQDEFGGDRNGAEAAFEKKFRQKTGLDWADRNEAVPEGKYRFVQQDFHAKASGYTAAKWQYWVDDGVDGKPTGWYDYTRDGSVRVERLYAEHASNRNLSRRVVSSGHFSYDVDLGRMRQTNTTHGTARRIRRCLVDEEEENEDST